MKLIKKIDEITFLASVNGKVIVVFEWENMLALAIHLKKKRLDKQLQAAIKPLTRNNI